MGHRGCLAMFAFVAAITINHAVISEKTFCRMVLEAARDIVNDVVKCVNAIIISPCPSPYTCKEKEG